MYILDNKDVSTLTRLTEAEITKARKADDVNDDELAHLYALKGKLAKVAASRDEVAKGGAEKPEKAKKPGPRAAATS